MGTFKINGAALALSALISGQAAQAENAIYQGECTRAYQVHASNTVDKLLKYSTYKASSLQRFGTEKERQCDSDTLSVWTLKQTKRSTAEVSFAITLKDIFVAAKAECEVPYVSSNSVYGSVKFTTKVEKVGEICEVYVLSEWILNDPVDTAWVGDFTNRVIMLSHGSMVVASSAPKSGAHSTPIGITGVQ
jgi:hypothetical protein